MPTAYRKSGVDFEDRFAPDIIGDGPVAANARAGGALLKFASIVYGTKGPDVGIREGGVDISNKWAAAGTAVYQTISPELLSLAVNIPLAWTGPSGIVYSYSLIQDGSGRAGTGPITPDQVFDWTSDGNPPARPLEVRLSNIMTDGDPQWVFVNLAGSWVTLNSTTSRVIFGVRYDATSGGTDAGIAGTALLEIRDAATGAMRFSGEVSFFGLASAF